MKPREAYWPCRPKAYKLGRGMWTFSRGGWFDAVTADWQTNHPILKASGKILLTDKVNCGLLRSVTDVLTTDFPFVEELPKREKSKVAKIWDAFQVMRAATKEHGCMVPEVLAAKLANISKQRIAELAEKGTLERIQIAGHNYITETSFLNWVSTERKAGRPPKVPTKADLWRTSVDTAKEIRSPRK